MPNQIMGKLCGHVGEFSTFILLSEKCTRNNKNSFWYVLCREKKGEENGVARSLILAKLVSFANLPHPSANANPLPTAAYSWPGTSSKHRHFLCRSSEKISSWILF
jgi:hypothetical protein